MSDHTEVEYDVADAGAAPDRDAAKVGLRGELDDLSVPATTGGAMQNQFGRMKAHLVARYRLAAVTGRPEELVRPGTSQGVSLGYGSKTIRLRLMIGREWVDRLDFQIKDNWREQLDSMCDRHFSVEDSDLGVPRPKDPRKRQTPAPINDL